MGSALRGVEMTRAANDAGLSARLLEQQPDDAPALAEVAVSIPAALPRQRTTPWLSAFPHRTTHS
ncbi:MAG: hypothetical protein JXR43_02730 [Burkholderiaceae bacterium]|nr:hypothetical protein [Burkholderiaceae bacterium]